MVSFWIIQAFFFPAFTFARRALCEAAIHFRAAEDSIRFLRMGTIFDSALRFLTRNIVGETVFSARHSIHSTPISGLSGRRYARPYGVSGHRIYIVRESCLASAKNLGTEPVRTAFRSPWQNGVAERWVGSCRRDLLDHVIVLNERHLKRLMHDYIRYYHEDRTHLGLAKDTQAGRSVARESADASRIQSFARLGGLHHRYAVAA